MKKLKELFGNKDISCAAQVSELPTIVAEQEMDEYPLLVHLRQSAKADTKNIYSPILVMCPSDIQAMHPNVMDPDCADICVGGRWYRTAESFCTIYNRVYGLDIHDDPCLLHDVQCMKNDAKNRKR